MAVRAQSGTLAANVVTSVTITDVYPDGITVVNRTQTGTIWARLDGTNPTVAGDEAFAVLGARRFPAAVIGQDTATVKLISSEALDYTVEGTVAWA